MNALQTAVRMNPYIYTCGLQLFRSWSRFEHSSTGDETKISKGRQTTSTSECQSFQLPVP